YCFLFSFFNMQITPPLMNDNIIPRECAENMDYAINSGNKRFRNFPGLTSINWWRP
ncbi:hypothetical protein HMPREF9372_3816, partial [Sporosarcina newyorkensis 2681]